jgi:hypothetical protein
MSEDTKGLPDVEGLAAFVQANTEDKAQTNTEDPAKKAEPAKQSQQADQLNLGQFKTPEDLLKAYKEVQGFSTRVAQESKQKDALLQQLQEQLSMLQVAPVQQPAPQASQKSFDELFIQNPEAAIAQVVNHNVRQGIQMAQIEGVLEEEAKKSPAEFNERYAYAQLMARQYPQAVQTAAGVRQLFKLGDQHRKEAMRRNAKRSISELFGDDVDLDKFKNLIRKDQQETNQNQNLAYMPDTTMSTRSGADTGAPGAQPNAIAEAVQRGDVDSVISSLFKERLGA